MNLMGRKVHGLWGCFMFQEHSGDWVKKAGIYVHTVKDKIQMSERIWRGGDEILIHPATDRFELYSVTPGNNPLPDCEYTEIDLTSPKELDNWIEMFVADPSNIDPDMALSWYMSDFGWYSDLVLN